MSTHQERAAEAGRTLEVTVTTATDELHGWMKPDACDNDEFLFTDSDTGETLTVKGWLAEVNPCED